MQNKNEHGVEEQETLTGLLRRQAERDHDEDLETAKAEARGSWEEP